MLPPEENVEYTSQEEVYGMIFDILDQAITNLHNPTLPTAQQFSFGEMIYAMAVMWKAGFVLPIPCVCVCVAYLQRQSEFSKQQGEAALNDPSA